MRTPVSRRQFLKTSAAAGSLASLPVWAQTSAATASGSAWALLGTGSGPGVLRSQWNGATGVLTAPEVAAISMSPSYLALHPRLPVVYACNEGSGPAATISAFTVHRQDAHLEILGSEPTGGDAPCYVSVDHTGRLLFAANYTGGSLAVFRLDANGKPAHAARVYASPAGKPGPVADRQGSPHLHCAVVTPENGYVLACDLGKDQILSFPIQPGAAAPLGDPQAVDTKPGAGPRHLAFHPNGRWVYCINELDCTVVQYEWRPHSKSARLVPGVSQPVSVLAYTGTKGSVVPTGAEVAISRDGRFLYASTRGLDLLTVFRIAAHDGALQQMQQLPCGGVQPRFFALDPTEKWLLCAHQEGNSVTTFARSTQTGELTLKETVPAPNPQCVVWL